MMRLSSEIFQSIFFSICLLMAWVIRQSFSIDCIQCMQYSHYTQQVPDENSSCITGTTASQHCVDPPPDKGQAYISCDTVILSQKSGSIMTQRKCGTSAKDKTDCDFSNDMINCFFSCGKSRCNVHTWSDIDSQSSSLLGTKSKLSAIAVKICSCFFCLIIFNYSSYH